MAAFLFPALSWAQPDDLTPRERQYKDSIDAVNALSAMTAEFQEAYNAGNTAYGEKKYADAISNYTKALGISPDFKEAWYNKGQAELSAKKYKEAAGFLIPLKDFPAFKPANKFQLALAQLKLHAHTVATNRQHPALELLSDLYRGSAYPVFETLRKDKNLAPEDLFALGFSLVERSGQEHGLGVDLLNHVAEKFPRNKIGKNAKNKLKLAGA